MVRITIEEYRELLNNHDWWYQYSDDPKYFHKGSDERARLRDIAAENKGLFELEFIKAMKEHPNA